MRRPQRKKSRYQAERKDIKYHLFFHYFTTFLCFTQYDFNGKRIEAGIDAIADLIKSPIDFEGGIFVINNGNQDLDECDNWTHCIVSDLIVSNYQWTDQEVEQHYSEKMDMKREESRVRD